MRLSAMVSPVFFALTLLLSACGGGGAAPGTTSAPTSIVVQPANVSAKTGDSVSFSVNASGIGLSYQWQRDGMDVPGATGASVTLNPAQLADDGSRWSVVVKSASGSLTSAVAVLTVNPPKGISVVAGVVGGSGNADGAIGRFQSPDTLAIDHDGVLYVDQTGSIRRIAPGTNGEMVVTTRGRAPAPRRALVADASGNLIGIVGNRIVRIAPDGVETTLAGSDQSGDADGTGAQARFAQPNALAIDAAGTIYVADSVNYKIRTVNGAGEVRTHAAATSALYDRAGDEFGQPFYVRYSPKAIAVDGLGNIFLGVSGANVRMVTAAGVRRDLNLSGTMALAADKAGNAYLMDQCAIQKIDPAGAVSLFAGTPGKPGMADGAGAVAAFGTSSNCDGSLAVDASGALYVADSGNNTVRKVSTAGVVTTIAGKAAVSGLVDGSGATARFNEGAGGLTYNGTGTLYLTQVGKVRKVTRAGVATTLNLPATDAAGHPIEYFTGGVAFQGSLIGVADHVLYLIEENGSMRALAGSPDRPHGTDGAGAQAGFSEIDGATRDGSGNVYVVDHYVPPTNPDAIPDWFENRIRKITPAGMVTTLYAPAHTSGQAQPVTIVADQQGNVYASTNNNAIIKIASGGAISVIPVDLQYSSWLSVDTSGNLYLGSAYGTAVVEKISPSGQAQIIAGKAGSLGVIFDPLPASLNGLSGLTSDERGVLYVLSENAIVRIVQ